MHRVWQRFPAGYNVAAGPRSLTLAASQAHERVPDQPREVSKRRGSGCGIAYLANTFGR